MSERGTAIRADAEEQLRGVLSRCAAEAISDQGNGKFSFDSVQFKRLFQKYWLYNDNHDSDFPHLNSAHGSYVFLLQKNISITNISIPENMALIRRCVVRSGITDKSGNPRVEFFTTRQYRRYIDRAISGGIVLFPSKKGALEYVNGKVVERVFESYRDFLLNTLAVSNYSTSFVLHIPRSVSINIENLVAQSGYIHSAGYQIYVALSDRSESAQLISNLLRIHKFARLEKPLLFAPYCEEYFSKEKYLTAYSMSNGLDGVKFAARKQHIGQKNLLELVDEIDEFDEFVVPKTDAFFEEKQLLDSAGVVARSATAFLFTDHGLDYSKTTRMLRKSEEKYVLCYLQQIKNSNKLHVIKERKPGWTGPITIPHTLAAAMINVTRQGQSAKDPKLVLDPFCGSSTFLIEAGIRFPNASLVGIDRHPLFHNVNGDNFEFISDPNAANRFLQLANSAEAVLDQSKHTGIAGEISKRLIAVSDPGADINLICASGSVDADCLLTALVLVLSELSIASGVRIHEISNKEVKKFLNNDAPFSIHLAATLKSWKSRKGKAAVYFIWRAICSNSYRLKAQVDLNTWVSYLCSQLIAPEVSKLKLEFQDISTIERGEFIRRIDSLGEESAFEISQGLYSPEIRLSNVYLAKLLSDKNTSKRTTEDYLRTLNTGGTASQINLLQGDSVEFLKSIADCVEEDPEWPHFRPDLIVTDPPYSFNVVEGDNESMQALFHNLVYLIPKVMAPRGVASIVVPSFSRNGQTIPFYQSNEVFTRRMISACAEAGRELLLVSATVPDSITYPKLPYSWSSQRGVSRHIMNFMIE